MESQVVPVTPASPNTPTTPNDTTILNNTTIPSIVQGNGVRLAYKVTTRKNVSDGYLLCFIGGLLGAHRFYLNDKFMGIVYLLTFGLVIFGWISDLIRMPKLVKRANRRIKRTDSSFSKPPSEIYLDEAYTLWFPFGILGK